MDRSKREQAYQASDLLIDQVRNVIDANEKKEPFTVISNTNYSATPPRCDTKGSGTSVSVSQNLAYKRDFWNMNEPYKKDVGTS